MSGYKCMYLVNEQVYKKLTRSNEECSKNALAGVSSNTNSIHINNENHGNSNLALREGSVNGSSDKLDKDHPPDHPPAGKFVSSIEEEIEPMEIGDKENDKNNHSLSNFRGPTTFEKAVPVNSEVQTDKPELKNSETQHESLSTSSIGINTFKNNKNKKIQTQKTINKDGESQTPEKNVKDSGVQTQKINSNKKRKPPLAKSEIKFSPNEKKTEIPDKVSDNSPISSKKSIPPPRNISPQKIVKSSDKSTSQPVHNPSLWGPPPEVIVNFPPKKGLKDILLNNPILEKPKPVGPIKRKSFFPESKRKKFKSEIAGKRKSENRSSRFPEKLPKRLKTVKSRISVLNPNQINSLWVDSDSENDN